MNDPLGVIGVVLADKFRVEHVLGEGGFGVVYAGTNLLLGAPIAIKLLKVDAVDAQGADEYLREARILFSLSHPAIVRMYDVGALERRGQSVPWVVLERLHGPTLDQEVAQRRAQNRPFSSAELREIFEPVLDGLAFAHERGILHRDLKPANLVLSRAPSGRLEPKLVDFGTARSQASVLESALGRTGFTPLYGAPEQWDPKLGAPSPATDVYAMGLALAEAAMLEKVNDEKAGLPAVLQAVMSGANVPAVTTRRPDLPPALGAFVARALALQPTQRFRDGREMRAAFKNVFGEASSSAMSPQAMTITPAVVVSSPPAFVTAAPVSQGRSGAKIAIVMVTVVLAFLIVGAGLGAVFYFVPATPKTKVLSAASVRASAEFDNADANAVVQRGQPAVESCAQRSTRFGGTIDVALEVSAVDGRVVSATCQSAPRGNPKAADLCGCVSAAAASWRFKPPKAEANVENLDVPSGIKSLIADEFNPTLHVNYTELP